MIQKAIIEAIENDYQVKVRIPKYDRTATDGLKYNELSSGIICTIPGTLVNYSIGDVVLVGFENDEINKPVVLGLLYTERETESSLKVPGLDSVVENINDSIDKINKTQDFIYIKYSNDGGITFTSLFDYNDTVFDGNVYTYKTTDDILNTYGFKINLKSSYLKWDITDKAGNNAQDKFDITTTVIAYFNNNNNTFISTDKVVDIPNTFNYFDEIRVKYSFSIKEGELGDYAISLTTDRDALGTVEGDYIGIMYSNSSVPSLNPVEYSWASIKTRIQEFIDDAYNRLLRRVRKNELVLYGEYDSVDEERRANTNTGLNSAVSIFSDSIDISKKQTSKIAQDVYIDTRNNQINFGNIKIMKRPNGHFTIGK